MNENNNNFNQSGPNLYNNNQGFSNQNIANNNVQGLNSQTQSLGSFPQPMTDLKPQEQTINNIESYGNTDSVKSPVKKSNLGLIIGIGAAIVVVVLGIIFGSKLFLNNKKVDNRDLSNDNSNDVVYYDKSRNLNDVYTFKEAVSEFAFVVNETSLIFKENEKIVLSDINGITSIYGDLIEPEFSYLDADSYIVYDINLGESNSSNLDEFVSNFKEGILNNNRRLNVKNVNIIEQNEEYVFVSCYIDNSVLSAYGYYLAEKIGDKVFYSYIDSIVEFNDQEREIFFNGFKELFNSLSADDGIKPYIYDKIMNVPMVMNKRIKYYDSIFNINRARTINSFTNPSLDGNVCFFDAGNSIFLEYGAAGHYEIVKWDKDLGNNTKYKNEDGKTFIGVKEENLTQLFEIRADVPFDNFKEFSDYFTNILDNSRVTSENNEE